MAKWLCWGKQRGGFPPRPHWRACVLPPFLFSLLSKWFSQAIEQCFDSRSVTPTKSYSVQGKKLCDRNHAFSRGPGTCFPESWSQVTEDLGQCGSDQLAHPLLDMPPYLYSHFHQIATPYSVSLKQFCFTHSGLSSLQITLQQMSGSFLSMNSKISMSKIYFWILFVSPFFDSA